jgi:hypothetical protein
MENLQKILMANNGLKDSITDKRKRKSPKIIKKKDAPEVPIFLKKTYHMVAACDPEIASWSNDGNTFVIKDPELFASEVIPSYFKHNNFSSFVRQLNFYGFRKIKLDPIKIDTAAVEKESKYWRFKHEKFLRGHPELLVEIRKANQSPSPDLQDVETLKKEVKSLKSQVSTLSEELKNVSALVSMMMKEWEQRKDYEPPLMKQCSLSMPEENGHFPDYFPEPATFSDKELLLEDLMSDDDDVVFQPGTVWPVAPISGRSTSIDMLQSILGCPESQDCSDIDQAMNLDADMFETDQSLIAKLNDALVDLPKDVQKMVMEKVISAAANQSGHFNSQPTAPSQPEYHGNNLLDPSPVLSSSI